MTHTKETVKSTSGNEWEVIIGLEIHSELNTRSKLFSEAPNRLAMNPI